MSTHKLTHTRTHTYRTVKYTHIHTHPSIHHYSSSEFCKFNKQIWHQIDITFTCELRVHCVNHQEMESSTVNNNSNNNHSIWYTSLSLTFLIFMALYVPICMYMFCLFIFFLCVCICVCPLRLFELNFYYTGFLFQCTHTLDIYLYFVCDVLWCDAMWRCVCSQYHEKKL